MAKRLKHLVSTLFTCLLVLIFVLVLFSAFSSRGVHGMRLGSYRVLHVLTGSMAPAIHAGSLLVIEEVPFSHIAVGDIITYYPSLTQETLLTHRVVSIDQDSQQFITRGDVNDFDDPNPVGYRQLAGRFVFAVPFLGALLSLLQTPFGMVSVVAVYILVLVIPKVYRGVGNKRHSGTPANPEDRCE